MVLPQRTEANFWKNTGRRVTKPTDKKGNTTSTTSHKIPTFINRDMKGLRQKFYMNNFFSCGTGVDSASKRIEYQESHGGKGRPAHKSDNITTTGEPTV
jgi:hypothetical protein